MINFQKLNGPFGIPVYFQPLPDLIKSVSLRLLVFVGAADDESAGGQPGVYHWFEHVPFRGTQRFPGGYNDTLFRFDHVSGDVGAYTRHQLTAYFAHVPKKFWQEALEVVIDLVACPLLTSDGITAERTVIYEELTDKLSKAFSYIQYHSNSMLWPGHPFGHPIIGSEEALKCMDESTLRAAQAAGYCRSRCALLVAGNVSPEEILEEFNRLADRLPDRKLSERRTPASYGDLPTPPVGTEQRIDIPFESSIIFLTFPVPPTHADVRSSLQYDILEEMCGGPQSPVMRLLREDRNLVYGAYAFTEKYYDGGIWGLYASTRPQNEQAVLEAMWRVIQSNELRTRQRFELVRQAQAGRQDMRVPDPDALTSVGEKRIAELSGLISDEEYTDVYRAISHEEVVHALDQLTPDQACTFVFHGRT